LFPSRILHLSVAPGEKFAGRRGLYTSPRFEEMGISNVQSEGEKPQNLTEKRRTTERKRSKRPARKDSPQGGKAPETQPWGEAICGPSKLHFRGKKKREVLERKARRGNAQPPKETKFGVGVKQLFQYKGATGNIQRLRQGESAGTFAGRDDIKDPGGWG